jgi:serine/threonine-protein kinase
MSLDAFNIPTEQLRLHRQDLPEPVDDPLVGRLLDSKYELVARLGEGGMGAVYRARRLHIGDEVAVKIQYQDEAGNDSGDTGVEGRRLGVREGHRRNLD